MDMNATNNDNHVEFVNPLANNSISDYGEATAMGYQDTPKNWYNTKLPNRGSILNKIDNDTPAITQTTQTYTQPSAPIASLPEQQYPRFILGSFPADVIGVHEASDEEETQIIHPNSLISQDKDAIRLPLDTGITSIVTVEHTADAYNYNNSETQIEHLDARSNGDHRVESQEQLNLESHIPDNKSDTSDDMLIFDDTATFSAIAESFRQDKDSQADMNQSSSNNESNSPPIKHQWSSNLMISPDHGSNNSSGSETEVEEEDSLQTKQDVLKRQNSLKRINLQPKKRKSAELAHDEVSTSASESGKHETSAKPTKMSQENKSKPVLKKQKSSKEKSKRSKVDPESKNTSQTVYSREASRFVGHLRILVTGIELDSQIRKEINAIHGATCEENVELATHIVVQEGQIKRTVKLLCGISCCDYIVDDRWLHESSLVEAPLPESEFIVQDKKAEKKWKFNLKRTMQNYSKVQRSQLYRGLCVALTPHASMRPPVDDLQKILECAGATVITSGDFKEAHVIITSAEALKSAKVKEMVCGIDSNRFYTTEFVLSSILQQEIKYDSNQIL